MFYFILVFIEETYTQSKKNVPSKGKDLKETVGFLYSSRHNPFSKTAFPIYACESTS